MNPVFEFLDGKPYRLNGVSGTLKHEVYHVTYPYPRVREELYHEPDMAGRSTSYYHEWKRQLGDDWSTCLTNDIAGYCAIAVELGYREG